MIRVVRRIDRRKEERFLGKEARAKRGKEGKKGKKEKKSKKKIKSEVGVENAAVVGVESSSSKNERPSVFSQRLPSLILSVSLSSPRKRLDRG